MATSAPLARTSLGVPSPAADRPEPLVVVPDAWRGLVDHAARAYPEEACGFLLSPLVPGSTRRPPVLEFQPAENERIGDRRRGFVISAAAVARAETSARRRGKYVSGFYHSHPDQPPVPSRRDTANAWPGFVYVIVASGRVGRPVPPRAYALGSEVAELREVALGLVDFPGQE